MGVELTDMFKFEDEFNLALELAKSGGKLIKEAFNKPKNVDLKSSTIDLVTETDTAVEKMILDKINSAFPTHKFIGEESVAASGGAKVEITSESTWIVDPVDGTTNFVHSFPYPCVAIAFMNSKTVEFSVIYNPIKDELFTAKLGFGAHLNGEKISCSPASPESVEGALLITEIGSSRDPKRLDAVFGNMNKLLDAGAHGFRSLGSCAMNMCAVACGRADAFYEAGMHIWDYSGAALIVREAGGCTIDMNGGELDLCARRVISAANSGLAYSISKNIESIELERD